MKVAASIARMFTARAHVRPCSVQSRPVGTLAHESSENVHRLARNSLDMLLCESQAPKRQLSRTGL